MLAHASVLSAGCGRLPTPTVRPVNQQSSRDPEIMRPCDPQIPRMALTCRLSLTAALQVYDVQIHIGTSSLSLQLSAKDRRRFGWCTRVAAVAVKERCYEEIIESEGEMKSRLSALVIWR